MNLHDSLKRAVASDSIDKGLDIIFEDFDEMYLDRKFKEIDQFLLEADVTGVRPTYLIGILSITLGARHQLPGRGVFFNKVQERFVSEKLCTKELLRGLDNS